MKFKDQVVWITGGGSGIGRAMALEFARQGADVAVSGRREDRLREVAAEIEALGRRALAVPCDVASEDSLRAAIEAVVEGLGGMDVAVANAGFGVAAPIEKLTMDDWRRQLDINVSGAAVTAALALPHLRQRQGRVAFVGSVAGQLYTPGTGAYSASKAALRAIALTLAGELHGSGVSVTLIQPGFVKSEISQVDNQGVYHPERADKRPAKLMWETDDAARVSVRAIHRRTMDFTFTAHGRFGAWMGQHAPGLTHFIVTRFGSPRRR